ncbi:MAG: fasciclin domain-containing protein [Acidimicrobiales bacterium]
MLRLRALRTVALIAALAVVTAACAGDEQSLIVTGENPETAPRDVVETIDSSYTSLADAIDAAGLGDDLSGEGPFTVFAPTDAAFDDLPDGLLAALLDDANSALLGDLLSHHVVEGDHTSAELVELGEVTSLEGSTIPVEETEEPATDEGAEPTTIIEVDDQAELTTADTIATNGIVHEIDQVLVPASLEDDIDEALESIPEPVDALSTLEDMGDFDTFLTLIEDETLDPELIGILTGSGPFTLFAPTDAAFEELTADQTEVLDTDPDLLETVLMFHVVDRPVLTEEVSVQMYLTTLGGEGARLANEGEDAYTFAGVPLAETDVETTNGVVHVVDSLLVPDAAQGPGGL